MINTLVIHVVLRGFIVTNIKYTMLTRSRRQRKLHQDRYIVALWRVSIYRTKCPICRPLVSDNISYIKCISRNFKESEKLIVDLNPHPNTEPDNKIK